MPATLKIKPQGIAGVTDLSVEIELEATVGTLKDQIANKLNLTETGVRLVCAGKVLAADEAALESYSVKDGSVLFCVKGLAKQQMSLPKTPIQVPPPEVKYADQLEELTSMGFDKDASLQALIKHAGDINLSVEMLANTAAATTSGSPPSTVEVDGPAGPTHTQEGEEEAAQRAKYVEQLAELKDMGFEDEKACLLALVKFDGEIDSVVEMLANGPVEGSAASYGYSEVVAHVYDISGGMAHSTSVMMTGKYMELIPHTGIVTFGREYHCSPVPASCEPGKSLPSPVKKTIRLGHTRKTSQELDVFLETLKLEYTAASYTFLTHNSNHFADAVAKFLLDGVGLPAELVSLMEDLNATPQGRKMAGMLTSMESSQRASRGGQSFFAPNGPMFHGGTPASPAFSQCSIM